MFHSAYVYNVVFLKVVESSRFHIESCSESSSLAISEALPEDSGRYAIFVRDRKSSAQHTVTLNVIGKVKQSSTVIWVMMLISIAQI